MVFILLTVFLLPVFADSTGFQEMSPEREKFFERRQRAFEIIRAAQGQWELKQLEAKKKKEEEERIAKAKQDELERIASTRRIEAEKRAKFKEDAKRGWEELLRKKSASEKQTVSATKTVAQQPTPPQPTVAPYKTTPPFNIISINKGFTGVKRGSANVTCANATDPCLREFCKNLRVPVNCQFNGKIISRQNRFIPPMQ